MIVQRELIGKLSLDDYDYNHLTNRPTLNGKPIEGEIDLSDYAKLENLDLKQNIEDENLVTTEKTIVGAINEIAEAQFETGLNLEFATNDDIDELFD